MRQEHRLVGDLLDDARFARRHLADHRDEHRLLLVGDRRHLHRHVEVFERDVAVAFAERAFRLEQFRIDQPLDHDFGIGRHVEIDGDAFHGADRLAGERAGDAHLVHVDGELLRAGEDHDRRAADDDRDRHRRLQLAVLQPVLIAAGAADPRGHAHAEPVGGFEPAAVGAHVLDAALRVLGDAERGGEIGRGVEAGRRDRHRQELQAAVRLLQVVALDDDLLARRGRVDPHRLDRMVDRVDPGLADLLDRLAHADGVDVADWPTARRPPPACRISCRCRRPRW